MLSHEVKLVVFSVIIREIGKVPNAKISSFLNDDKTETALKEALLEVWRKFEANFTAISMDSTAQQLESQLLTKPNPAEASPKDKAVVSQVSVDIQPFRAMSNSQPHAVASPSSKPKEPNPMRRLEFSIANGNVGQAYHAKIEMVSVNAPAYVITAVNLPQGTGIIYDPAEAVIKGKPLKDGEIDVEILYTFTGNDSTHSASMKMTVNPDPKSLWKNIPSDRNAPYWKPDEDMRLVRGGDLLLLGASKRGRSHAHVGSFRDDDFNLEYLPDGDWSIAVVSDGAGSAKYSRRGAEIICQEGGAYLSTLLKGEDGDKLIAAVEHLNSATASGDNDAAKKKVQNQLYYTLGYAAHHACRFLEAETQKHKELGRVFKDYSSTAIIAVCRRFSFGVLCAAYWVGDGVIAALDNSGNAFVLGEADAGEFSGQTRFLSAQEVSPDALLRRIKFEIIPDFKALVLMTDGVSDPYFEVEANLKSHEKWDAFFSELDAKIGLSQKGDDLPSNLMGWLNFWSVGNHDDRTLALIY